MNLEERVRALEIDVAVIKAAVTNHIPTQIRQLRWLIGLVLAGLIAVFLKG